jgi:SAM-dependent methyltransferase
MEHALSYKTRNYIHEKASYEPQYPQEEFIVPMLRNSIMANLQNLLEEGALHKRVLDIGCGKQPFRAVFERYGCQYYGLDVQTHENVTVDFVAPIDQELPAEVLQQGGYDFILCTEVLEHVANWHAAFGNIAKLLKPGGRVLLSCPHFYQLHEEPYDFWRPTNHAIEIYARNYGLQTVRIEKAGDAWDVLGTWMANCQFYITSSKLTHRLFFRLFQGLMRRLWSGLKSRQIQGMIGVHTPLYMVNVAVLEK